MDEKKITPIGSRKGRPRGVSSWMSNCVVCNVGLIKELDGMIESGMKLKQAARILEEKATKENKGVKIISAGSIRERYRYHKLGKTNWNKTESKSNFEDCLKSFLSHLRTATNSLKRMNMNAISNDDIATGLGLMNRVDIKASIKEISSFLLIWETKIHAKNLEGAENDSKRKNQEH